MAADKDRPDLGRVRGRTCIATWAESDPANHCAFCFGHEELRHAFVEEIRYARRLE